MKNETLLDRAILNYVTALKLYKYSTGDERELNTIGYLLQQCCELCIKHFIECNGVRYPHEHSIEDLLDLCIEKSVPLKFDPSFYNFAPAITKWEAKTRYIKNYKLASNQVVTGFRMIRDFLISNGVAESALELQEPQLRKIDFF